MVRMHVHGVFKTTYVLCILTTGAMVRMYVHGVLRTMYVPCILTAGAMVRMYMNQVFKSYAYMRYVCILTLFSRDIHI